MMTSKSIQEIAKALNKAQAAMTGASKSAENPFFKSSYADLPSVMLAIKEALAANGLSFVQAPLMNDDRVGVTTRIMHVSGEYMQSTLMLPLVKKDPQAAGSAITYAKRYALQSMAGVPSTDDDAEAAMKRAKVNDLASAISAHFDDISVIKSGLVASPDNSDGFTDLESAAEAWFGIPEDVQRQLWVAPSKGGCFSTEERKIMKTAEFKSAHYGEQT